MRRPPAPLAAILCIAALQALAWSVVLPAFQGQDEAPHFSYTQRLVETGKPTWFTLEKVPDVRSASTELSVAMVYAGLEPLAANVSMRPYATEIDERRWRAVDDRLGDDERGNGQYTSSMRNPPLYYLYESVVYAPLESASIFTRASAMRWATIPFVLIAVLGAWLLAGEVFGRRRWLQAVTALFVALQPMLAQLGGVVNPDAAIAAVYAVALWLSAVIVNRGLTRGRVAGAAAAGVAALLTHGRAAPAVIVLLAALVVGAWPWVRRRRAGVPLALGSLAVAVVGFLAAGTWYALRGEISVARIREFASYVWQFYLPRPGFMEATPRPDWGVREVFVDRLWSGFAHLEINLAPGVLDAISIATMAGAVIVLATLVWRRDVLRRRWPLALVLATAPLALMLFLHIAAWRDLPVHNDPIITGRYLTPLLPLAGLAVAAVAGSLPRRVGPAAALVVLGLEALIALAALAIAVGRFYV